ncbi:hypothetical protein IAD21_04431 [Abditibacteriota bacterium]|nr:hypothetical protein IAD21_04431 [Abditibacteriota bacterium]
MFITRPNVRGHYHRCFTLVELLVVIGIIAILAAILFPVFARARENARRTSCQSNLKQIGLGILQYQQDYDEHYPSFSARGVGWVVLTRPYVKSTQLFQCPSEPTAENEPSLSSTGPGNETDYAYNMMLGFDTDATVLVLGRAVAAISSPALVVMATEEKPWAQDNWTAGCGSGTYSGCAPGLLKLSGAYAQRHLEGINYVFCDGHVKWYKSTSSNQSSVVYNSCVPGKAGGQVMASCGSQNGGISSSTIVSGTNPTLNVFSS